VQHRREAVLPAGQPAAAGVVDAGGEAGGGLDEGAVVELDEGGAAVQALDVQRRQRDQVLFVVAGQAQDGVAHLLHHDRQRPRHRRLLPVVALQVHAVRRVPDAVGCHRRVVRHLLADELRRARVVLPFAKEELAQEGVERLLLAAEVLASAGVLLLEGGEEPFEDEKCALGGILLCCWRDKDGWMCRPVCGEFD